MKSLRLFLVALPVLVVVSCSQAGVNGSGGSSGGSSGGTTGSGGGNGSGGSASGGTMGSGGATSGSGGATTGSGGDSAGSGGSSTGSGGSTTGSGGASTGSGGSTTGSGGASTGSGGGSAGGRAGTGGSTGTGGAAGGSSGGSIDVPSFAGIPNQFNETLASSFLIVPCYSTQDQDCNTIPTGMTCGNQSGTFEKQGVTQTETFKVGGTTGTMYAMTFNVAGIAEAKYYMGGTRDAGTGVVATAQDANGSDTFYRGGSPVAVEHYNIYKMTVKDAAGTEVEHYYLNSFPQTTVAYENHQTFPLKYTKTIPVPGGGSVELFMGDSNCRAVNNCGPGVFSGVCSASRKIPETGFTVPTMYMGKAVSTLNAVNGAAEPYHAQLIHIVVTAVAKM
jgi:hypothetical protein